MSVILATDCTKVEIKTQVALIAYVVHFLRGHFHLCESGSASLNS